MPGTAHNIIDLKGLGLVGDQINCHYTDDAMRDPKRQGETRDIRWSGATNYILQFINLGYHYTNSALMG